MKIKNLSVMTILPLLLTGCGKSNCDLVEDHLHKYRKDACLVRYEDNESLTDKDGFSWSDEVLYVNDAENKYFYSHLYDEGLISIDDNIDYLYSFGISNIDSFTEYRYKVYKQSGFYDSDGNYHDVSYYCHGWTTNPNHSNLTGEERKCHFEYTAYNLYIDEYGDYCIDESDTTSDIMNIINNRDKFPYVKVDFYKTIDERTDKKAKYEQYDQDEPYVKIMRYIEKN